MNSLATEIRTRGYWRVVIRPTLFVESRVKRITELQTIIRKTSVQFRGWDFPHVPRNHSPSTNQDWIGEETSWEHYRELWRLYTSGQFVALNGINDDWRDVSKLWPVDSNWEGGKRLGVGEVLFSLTEFLEFASRLAHSDIGDEEMHLEITLNNIEGRVLFVDSHRRTPLSWSGKATIRDYQIKKSLTRSELLARSTELAVEYSIEIFDRFDCDLSPGTLKNWQNEILRRQ